MTNDRQNSSSPNGTLRTVAVVMKGAQPDVLDTLLDAGGYDVVFVESLDRAYSSIKRAAPQQVIVCTEIDDAECVQLLSMLRLDSETSAIPVCTYFIEPCETDADKGAIDLDRYAPLQPAVVRMN